MATEVLTRRGHEARTMPRKIHGTTERMPPAGTAEKMSSSRTSAPGDSPRVTLPAPHCGPAPPPESLPPPDSAQPLDSSIPNDKDRPAFGVRDTLTLSQLRYFMAVCDTLSFTGAARKCGISQPALLRSIRKLENALGARLFRLEPARRRPTELAQLLRPQLQMNLASAEAAKEAAGKFASENPTARTRMWKRRRQIG